MILAFDVSGSMAATDLAPTRMEAAKAAARAFVERQPPSVRIGVVAFSDSGFSIQVPTNDQAEVVAAIDRLAPERGTSIGQRDPGVARRRSQAADADPATDYYSNALAARPTPAADPGPAGHVRPGDHRAADRRREHQPTRSARGGRRPRRTAACGSTRSAIGSAAGTTLEVEGFTVHTPARRGDAPADLATITDGTYYAGRGRGRALRAIYDDIDTPPRRHSRADGGDLAVRRGRGPAPAHRRRRVARWLGRLP